MKKVEKSKKVVSKKEVKKTPLELAFEKFISKDEYKVAVHCVGKKKLLEVFKAGTRYRKVEK